ncbi:RluA family pseudouridine synthase [Calderihabitans maritimus]|uniref:Pseudouridine synthase n=1 Tax=Calderihabitans maritimus TaxID=1246530 RepID=A0A1Z5HSU5_9FIRM|nr:RluA family pseudouridine synthase [Calderihabitans maritimus]GAW92606.1 RluA family pseudouridine synthase [Calderihabitans maritimus]
MEEIREYRIETEQAGERIDRFLAARSPDLSRSWIQRLIREQKVTVDGETVKPNYKLKTGDCIKLIVPPPEEPIVKPEKIPLDILFEDQDIIVVNKPQGMVVHPAAGNFSGTLVNALLYHCKDLSGINGVLRPGIVHRIDKDTSGVLVVAKNDSAHLELAAQIKAHRVKRVYIALVHGDLAEPAGTIDAPIGRDLKDRKRMAVVFKGARRAVTHYKILERFGDFTLIEAQLETGRTHQIRVHMAYLGHPVAGDPKYGPRKPAFGLKGQALHAKLLGIFHPRTKHYMEFEAPLPKYFQELLTRLRSA